MKMKYLILAIFLLIIAGVIFTSIPKGEKQKILLDSKEISCNSSLEKGREVCLSYAVNEMNKSIAWAGIHLSCENNVCWTTE